MKNEFRFIDSWGVELPFGDFVHASCFLNGWAEIESLSQQGNLIWEMLNRNGEKKAKLSGTTLEQTKIKAKQKGNYFALDGWTKDLTILCTIMDWDDNLRRSVGIWSFSRQEWLAVPKYSYASLRYTDKGFFPLLSPNGILSHINFAGDNIHTFQIPNFIVKHFGEIIINEDKDTSDTCIIQELLPNKRSDARTKFALLNVCTGDCYGWIKALKMGIESENKRYVVDETGTEIITDSYGIRLFRLPYQSNFNLNKYQVYPRPVLGGIETSIFFNSDRMSVPYWDEKGVRHFYLIDNNGEIVIPPGKFDSGIKVIGNKRILLCKNSNWALADYDGTLITDFSYKLFSTKLMNNRIVMGKRMSNKKIMYGALDAEGKEAIPFEFACIASQIGVGSNAPFSDNATLIRI